MNSRRLPQEDERLKKSFLQALDDGGLVGDGAMGSLLYERGVYVNRNFDEVNIQQAELVGGIHREYLLSGAHVLESNTYGANRIRLERHALGDKFEKINVAAMDAIKGSAEGAAYIGGSMGPTGLGVGELRRVEDRVREGYAEQASLLASHGADLLLIETFRHPPELRLAIEGARTEVTLPIVAQFTVDEYGRVSDGTDPVELAKEIMDWGADVVGVNCNGPQVIFDVAVKLVELGVPICAYPNAGRPQTIEDRLIYLATPENFGVVARRMYKAGVKLVGGCCGTGPSHITKVASAARMVWPKSAPTIELVPEKGPELEARPLGDRSAFGNKLGKEFVISVEVNPGQGLSMERQLTAAKMLTEAGSDVINIADGPRATARMNNIALGVTMQQRLGIEVLLHLCCRDRNLLGLQAAALGAHALGLRNMVVITGDPPKVGDYPDATAVYDIDSIGLLGMLRGFNHGVDFAGKSLGAQTEFVLCTGAEPAALDFKREMMRLRQKVEAGANCIMTQPIYDPAHLDRFLEASSDINVPVLVGILPLASHRNAEFIHHHIPGMQIPKSVRDRMRKAGKGDDARKVGVEIAIESLLGVRKQVSGAYIMPPLGRYDMAAEILRALGKDRVLTPGIPGISSTAA